MLAQAAAQDAAFARQQLEEHVHSCGERATATLRSMDQVHSRMNTLERTVRDTHGVLVGEIHNQNDLAAKRHIKLLWWLLGLASTVAGTFAMYAAQSP